MKGSITMKNAKSLIDKLAQNPELALSMDKFGSETWTRKEPLTQYPVPDGKRRTWARVIDKFSSDDLIIQILKKNPGTELQLFAKNGMFPYIALHINGYKIEELKVPEGVFYFDDYIYAEAKRLDTKLCLLAVK